MGLGRPPSSQRLCPAWCVWREPWAGGMASLRGPRCHSGLPTAALWPGGRASWAKSQGGEGRPEGQVTVQTDPEAWRKCGDHRVAGEGHPKSPCTPSLLSSRMTRGKPQGTQGWNLGLGAGQGLGGGAGSCGRGSQPERGGVPNLGAAAEGREPPPGPGAWGRGTGPGRGPGESAERRATRWGPESSSGQKRIIIVLMDTAAPWL